MAQIGSLTVDLELNSASFVADMGKAANSVVRNTGEISTHLGQLRRDFLEVSRIAGGVFAGDFGLRALGQLKALVDSSLKLAQTMGGDLASSAELAQDKIDSFRNAFDLGVAQGFIEGLNGDLKITQQELGALTQLGQNLGRVLGSAFEEIAQHAEVIEKLQILGSLANNPIQGFPVIKQLVEGTVTLDQLVDRLNASLKKGNPFDTLRNSVTRFITDLKTDAKDTAGAWQTVATPTKEWSDAVRALPGILKETESPLERYRAQIEQIALLQENGLLTAQQSSKGQQQAALDLADSYVSAASQITSTLAGAFQNNKAFAIANAVVNVAEGITQALKLPFPLNWVQAAAVTAAGAVQIAAIEHARPGSASRPSVGHSGGGGGGGSRDDSSSAPAKTNRGSSQPTANAASIAGGIAAAPTAMPAPNVVDIHLHGNNYSRDSVRQLVESINDYVRDGGVVRIAS